MTQQHLKILYAGIILTLAFLGLSMFIILTNQDTFDLFVYQKPSLISTFFIWSVLLFLLEFIYIFKFIQLIRNNKEDKIDITLFLFILFIFLSSFFINNIDVDFNSEINKSNYEHVLKMVQESEPTKKLYQSFPKSEPITYKEYLELLRTYHNNIDIENKTMKKLKEIHDGREK